MVATAASYVVLPGAMGPVATNPDRSDADLAAARSAGLDDAGIAETVANVALNIFTNYFNHVVETAIDFPPAAKLDEPVAV